MSLSEIIQKILPGKRTHADPELITLLVELQEDKGQIVHTLTKETKKVGLQLDIAHVLNIKNPGTYELYICNKEGGMIKNEHFPKTGMYFFRTTLEEIEPMAIDPFGNLHPPVYRPQVIKAPIGSRLSYEQAIALVKESGDAASRKDGIFELAAILRDRLKTLPEDKYDDNEKMPAWPKILTAVALTLFATAGTKMYVDHYVSEKNKQKTYENSIIQRKDTEHNESLTRKQREEENQAAMERVRKSFEETLKQEMIKEQERRKINAEYSKLAQETINEQKEGIRKDLKTTLQKRGIEADISDVIWEGFISDPFTQSNGENWMNTTFTIETKEPAYSIRAEFYTTKHKHSIATTKITTQFSITKDGKRINFTEKGEIITPTPSEADKQYIKEFTQKHKIAEIRKEVIDTIIEKRGSHQAHEYKGRD